MSFSCLFLPLGWSTEDLDVVGICFCCSSDVGLECGKQTESVPWKQMRGYMVVM